MSFGQSVKYCLGNYAKFDGRASRSEFWWFYLFYAIVVGIPYVIGYILLLAGQPAGDMYGNVDMTFPAGAIIFYIIAGLLSLALFIPYLAVSCRRLHDRGTSGWLNLLLIIPCANLVVFVFWLLEGTPGPNAYGEGPVRA